MRSECCVGTLLNVVVVVVVAGLKKGEDADCNKG